MQDEKISSPPVRAIIPQVYTACTILLSGFAVGMSVGHSAVLLPHLKSENSTIVVDEDMESWIASVYSIVGPIGCIFGGILIDIWGRKKLVFAGNICLFLGWIAIACAQNGPVIIIGRILEGISRNVLATSLTVLTDELTDPRIRGNVLCGCITSVSAGIIGISGLSAFLHWRTASGVAAVFSLLSALMFYFVRESPIWLLRKNRNKEAEQVLKYIWGPGKESQVREEIADIKFRLQLEQGTGNHSIHRQILSFVRQLLKPHVLKPFLIMHFFNAIQAFCGFNLITVYTVDIISKIRSNGTLIVSDYTMTIIISSLRTFAVFLMSIFTNRVGRRKIAIASGTCSFVSSFCLGLLLLVRNLTVDPFIPELVESYVKFCLVAIFVVGMSSGYLFLPAIMIGETQNSSIRGIACGYMFTTNDLILGGIVKLYPKLMFTLKIHGLFLMFGISCAICTIFVYLFLPETQGLSLQQIEDYFRQPNILWARRERTRNKLNQKEESDANNILLK